MQSLLEEERAKQRRPPRIVATAAINIKVRAETLFLHEEALALAVESSAAPFALNNPVITTIFLHLFFLRFTTINDLHFSLFQAFIFIYFFNHDALTFTTLLKM